MRPSFASVDAYIASFPPDVQAVLESVRQTIREAVPEATEKISYGIPTFTLSGNLIHFAAYKDHLGIYGQAGAAVEAFGAELAPHMTGKGTLRFSLTEPPLNLIGRVADFQAERRRAEIAARAAAKRKPARSARQ